MSRKYLQELIKSLRELYKCPSCGTNYHLDDIKFLGEVDAYCFVQLSCHDCSLPLLATLSINSQLPLKSTSDISDPEKNKFDGKGAISSDEIAEFHRFITDFDGRLSGNLT